MTPVVLRTRLYKVTYSVTYTVPEDNRYSVIFDEDDLISFLRNSLARDVNNVMIESFVPDGVIK